MIENKIVIKRTEIAEGTEFVEIPFDEWNASVGDEGYYLVADVDKCGSHKCFFTEKEDQEYILKQSLMPIFCVKNKDGFTRILSNLHGSCTCQLIWFAFDKIIKSILSI